MSRPQPRALRLTEALEQHLIPDSVQLTITRDYGETANEKANELLFHLGLATVSIIGLVLLAAAYAKADRSNMLAADIKKVV